MLSVVVIGRNEGAKLASCFASVRAALANVEHELLYVDSHSADDSPRHALEIGARCCRLRTADTTAALARRVGAIEAVGERILFLDGDMQLAPGFVQAAEQALAEGTWAGAIGVRRDVYVKNGVPDVQHATFVGTAALREAISFGGALYIDAQALKKAGNWCGDVIACEEAELKARLDKTGARVADLPVAMATHFDHVRDNRGIKQILVNKRRLGYGQALVAAARAGSLLRLARNTWESLVCLAIDLGSLVALCAAPRIALPTAIFLQALQLVWFRFSPDGLRGYAAQKLLFFYLPAGLMSYRKRDEAYEVVTTWPM